MKQARWRLLLTLPLLWFVYKGHSWAVVTCLGLSMLGAELSALVCQRLIERNRELLDLLKKLDARLAQEERVNKVLSETFKAK